MKLIDKFKNMFIEEEEYEEEVEEPIKKEVIQVEIPSPKQEEPIESIEEPIEPEIFVEEPKDEEKEFKFPVYFDDKDFESLKRKEEPVVEPRHMETYEPKREVYEIKKEEEKKTFKPTPIISPVYGVLDKNYRKDEIVSKKRKPTYEYLSNDKVDIDDVRKKAYGTLEDDLENNLFEKTSILFNDEVEEVEKEIEESKENVLEEVELDYEVPQTRPEVDVMEEFDDIELPEEEPVQPSVVEDLPNNLIEEELNKDHVEEEKEERYVDEMDNNDLFNLIDAMYEKGEN